MSEPLYLVTVERVEVDLDKRDELAGFRWSAAFEETAMKADEVLGCIAGVIIQQIIDSGIASRTATIEELKTYREQVSPACQTAPQS